MALVPRLVGRHCLLRRTLYPLFTSRCLQPNVTAATQAHATVEGETFKQKQKRLKRPLSPHLSIYKPQLTSLISVSNRGTGVLYSSILSGFAIGMLILPGNFPYYCNMIQALHVGPAIIFGAKFILAWPLTFHIGCGIRHLVWDLGHGLSMPVLYKTGWTVVAVSALLALGLAAL